MSVAARARFRIQLRLQLSEPTGSKQELIPMSRYHSHAMPLIELRNIDKTYRLGDVDVPVLKNVSLSIERGEFVALMGASGSGKTTLMNLLGCLDRPTAGSYRFDGVEVDAAVAGATGAASQQPHRLCVSELQSPAPRHGAWKTCGCRPPTRPRRRPRGSVQQRSRELLATVGLGVADGSLALETLRRRAAARGHRPVAGEPAHRCCWPTSRRAISTRARARRSCNSFAA